MTQTIGVLAPEGELTPDLTRRVMEMVGSSVSGAIADRWSRSELAIAYDWATREYLLAADNHSVRKRTKPWFVTAAEVLSAPLPLADPEETMQVLQPLGVEV